MQANMSNTKEIVYRDAFIAIVKDAYEVDGGKNHTIVSKGMIRYWLYNSDMSVVYCHSELSKKLGYKSISEPKEGVIKAEFTDNQFYLFNLFGKLLKPFSFTDVSDFNNGFARIQTGKTGYGCLIDHAGNLILQNSKNKLIIIPDEYSSGAVIDDDHIVLHPKNDKYFYLFDGSLNPITLHEWNGDLHINFESFENGACDWCIHLINCSCFANHNVRTKLCVFNLSTNKVCYTDPTNYNSAKGNNQVVFTPIGNDCIHYTSVVKNEEREWDSDDRCYYTRKNDYISETLYFKNGQFFSGYSTIELLPELQLILIKGGTFIVNNDVQKSQSGCFSYSGETLIPVIYSDIKFSEKHFKTKDGEASYKFNLQGQLLYKRKKLPREINLYDELEDGKLLVRHYAGQWGRMYQFGIYDAKESRFILPLDYTFIEKTSVNTFIVCKEDKYGLLDANYSLLIPCKYASFCHIDNDLYICSIQKDSSKEFGIVDHNDSFIVEAKYYKIYVTGDNMLSFESHYYDSDSKRKNTTDFALNTIVKLDDGGVVTLHGFWDLAGSFSNDYCRFVGRDDKWGIVNKDSAVVTKKQYDFIDVVGIPNVFVGKIRKSIYLINPDKKIEKSVNCEHYWTNQQCYDNGYIFISNDGGEGLINSVGDVLLECDYSFIYIDSNYFGLKKGELVGKADLDGNIIIPCVYERFEMLSNGYYIANNEFAYLLSPYGSIVTPPNAEFKAILETKADCLKIVTVDESGHRHYGLISLKGRLKRKTDLSYIGAFDSGKAIANFGGTMSLRYNHTNDREELFLEGGKYGVIDENGNFIIEPLYSYIGSESEGYRAVSMKDNISNHFGMIKVDGSPVIECKYSYTRNVVSGMIVFAVEGTWRSAGCEKEKLRVMKNEQNHYLDGAKWGIIDVNGNILFEPFADFMQVISEGKVTYRIGDKYGIIDLSSKTKQLTDYNYLSSFHEGRCIAGKYGKYHSLRFGYIKDDYSELVPCEYDKAYHFKDGKGVLESGGTQDTVDLDGNLIDSYTEDYPYDSSDNYDWERETWFALTGGQYGDYPGSGVDYDFLGY